MKQLLNFLQIIVMVNFIDIGLPDWFNLVPNLIGAPIDSMKQALDCAHLFN